MALNFPNSPSEGHRFGSFVFTGGLWKSSTTPRTALPFNYFVNPAMQVSAENADTAGTMSAYFPADQWQFINSGFAANIKRAAESAATAPNGSRYALNLSLTTARPSAMFSDVLSVMQIIEGVRVADLQWGTANAKAIVLRFWFKSGIAGKTLYAALRNGGPDRSYIAAFTTATTGWEQISIAVPGDTTGTWATGTGRGLQLNITAVCGSDLHGVAGWQAGNKWALSASSSNGGTTLSLFLADVGLYADPYLTGKPPPWEAVSDLQATLDSMRYYNKPYIGVGVITAATTIGRVGMTHIVQPRVAPGVTRPAAGSVLAGALTGSTSAISTPFSNTTYWEYNGTIGGASFVAPNGAITLSGVASSARM